MKVLVLKDHRINEKLSICKGQLFKVRPVEFNGLFVSQNKYQIIDVNCMFSGEFLPAEYCLEQDDDENIYTEKEVDSIKNFYLEKISKLREENEKLKIAFNKKHDVRFVINTSHGLKEADREKLQEWIKKAFDKIAD